MSYHDMRSCKEPELHLCILNRDPKSEAATWIGTHDVMSTPDELGNVLIKANMYDVSIGDTQGTYVFVIILVKFELAWKHDVFPSGREAF